MGLFLTVCVDALNWLMKGEKSMLCIVTSKIDLDISTAWASLTPQLLLLMQKGHCEVVKSTTQFFRITLD